MLASASLSKRIYFVVGIACVALSLVGLNEVRDSVEEANSAEQMITISTQLDRLLRLRSAIAEEQMVATVRDLAITPNEIDTAVDEIGLIQVQQRTDDAIAEFDEPPIDELKLGLARGRGSFGKDDYSNRIMYRELVEDVTLATVDALSDSRDELVRLGWSGLNASLERLVTVSDLDRLSTQVVIDLVDLWSSSPIDAPRLAAQLEADRLAFETARAALPSADIDPIVAESLGEELVDFDRLIDRALLGQRLSDFDPSDEDDLAGLGHGMARAQKITAVARAQSTQDLETLERGATSARRRSIAVGVGFITILTALILLSFYLARSIVNPLRRLSNAAANLRWGRTRELGLDKIEGPKEVQVAAEALAGAAVSLDVLKRKATTVAQGDLSDPILGEQVPGEIGQAFDQAIAAFTAAVDARLTLARRMEHEMRHDTLTGLMARVAVIKAVADAVDSQPDDLAVAHLDLCQFRELNVMFGSDTGDRVLKEVAGALLRRLKDHDSAGRLGADEFLIVYVGDNARTRLHKDMGLCIEEIEHRVGSIDGLPPFRSRVGIAESHGIEGADELVSSAMHASELAREEQRGPMVTFDESTRAEVDADRELELSLRNCLERGVGLEVHYQPIIDATTRRPVGVEALCRWNRPGYGMVSPTRFIAIAERSELVVDLDIWVMDQAMRQVHLWNDDPILASLWMSINVSGRHVAQRSLVPTVRSQLQLHNVSSSQIVIEMTETVLATDLHGIAERLQVLRDLGLRVAVDDFGSGYTGLGQLRSLPIDELKIDRSLLAGAERDPVAADTVGVVCDLARLLECTIVAEGIESAGEALLLESFGVELFQGNYFAGAMDATHATEWLRAEVTKPTIDLRSTRVDRR